MGDAIWCTKGGLIYVHTGAPRSDSKKGLVLDFSSEFQRVFSGRDMTINSRLHCLCQPRYYMFLHESTTLHIFIPVHMAMLFITTDQKLEGYADVLALASVVTLASNDARRQGILTVELKASTTE